jgi:hypothetical protein
LQFRVDKANLTVEMRTGIVVKGPLVEVLDIDPAFLL